jgi:molecular chaperone DnaK
MINEAESNRTTDLALREAIDARNELDAAAYQVERRLDDLGDAAPEHERARAQLLIDEARTAVKEEAPVDRSRSLTSELQQIFAALAAHAAGPGGAGAGAGAQPGAAPGQGPEGGSPGGDDDVIDADFDKT